MLTCTYMKIYEILLCTCLCVLTNTVYSPDNMKHPASFVVPLVEDVEEVVPPHPILDDRQLACLQKNVYFEARGEGRAGMRAVANATMNRVKDPRFPKTVCDVVYQPSQFSWTRYNPRVNLTSPGNRAAWETAGEVAEKAIIGTLVNNVGSAQYFHAKHVNPSWSRRFNLVATVNSHVFYHQPL